MASFDSTTEHISGLAGEIKSSITSEQFDLANYSEQKTREMIFAAFSTPLTVTKSMIRFTFVVGGGKLVRARYDDDLIRWITTALREIGFMEDKSAAETFDSQGTYKQQHDTGQNLKYVIVFPRVAASIASPIENNIEKVDESSPEYIVTACEVATFKEIVSSKVQSWRQKKKLLKILSDYHDKYVAVETKLISGAALSSSEQAIYDNNPGNDTEKITWLQSEMKSMVDNGKLTLSEKQELLLSLDNNIKSLSEEAAKAVNEGQNQKAEKIEQKKRAILARKAVVDKIVQIEYRLVHGNEIQKLCGRLYPLLALEDRSRSMSLTLADLKAMEEKPELESKITQLENASRGWFENEEDFKAKCEIERAEGKDKAKKLFDAKKPPASGSKTSSSSSNKTSSMGAWSTVSSSKRSGNNGSTGGAKKASGFAAAFDDDSD